MSSSPASPRFGFGPVPSRRLTPIPLPGIAAFARLKRRGKLWIEVMLVAGLNATEPALRELAA